FPRYIALHKEYRHLLHSGRSFRIDPADKNQNIYGIENENEMLITVCQLAMPDHALPSPLRISCSDVNAKYLVKLVEMPQTSFQLMKQRPKWLDRTLTLSGDNLKEIGLNLPILDPESALIVHLQKI
ncbi:alpha-galactosidase, partial [Vibrio vulnificus]|nr:alpha-galactosidase [Vibrio vulnificus]